MRTWVRALAGTALTVSIGLASPPPASAVDYGKPLPAEWWFTAWDIQDKVWPISQGDGVTVAVIDSGVEASLPEFSGGVVLPGVNAGNTKADGWTDGAEGPGHGTGMAAFIAAQGKGSGYLGVAPKVKILPIIPIDDGNVPGSIRFAVDHGALVINISLGSTYACTDEEQTAVAYAIQRDVVVVASAGNEGHLGNASSSPANCVGVLAVGAVDRGLTAWYRTERQPYVAVSAPGVDTPGLAKDGRVVNASGTSQASALTAGVAALVRSRFPQMSAREVVQRIIASCRPAQGPRDAVGAGAVRPFHALVDNVPKNAPNPVFVAYDEWVAARSRALEAPTSTPPSAAKDDSGPPMQTILMGIGGIALLTVIGVAVGRGGRRNRFGGTRGVR
jgi:subtilisin family serine protease